MKIALTLFLVAVTAGYIWSFTERRSFSIKKYQASWSGLLRQFRCDAGVHSLIFVQYTENSRAVVQLYTKDDRDGSPLWTKLLSCEGFVGREGIGKEAEGDDKTPAGTFGVTTAFGIKENPGTDLPYIDVTDDIFCCDERGLKYYNRIISFEETGHQCKGEHMIEYSPQYNYGMFLDYNAEQKKGLGSAIFIHCEGPNDYTAGCIAVSEENMKFILQHVTADVKVCIYDK